MLSSTDRLSIDHVVPNRRPSRIAALQNISEIICLTFFFDKVISSPYTSECSHCPLQNTVLKIDETLESVSFYKIDHVNGLLQKTFK